MPSPRRDAAIFAHALLALLPEGPVWPRRAGARLVAVMSGLAGVVARWAADAWRFLHVEAFPPTSLDLLADWERVLGLPEPCLPLTDMTVTERQRQVAEKLARRPGTQSRAYFVGIAQRLGYAVTITEFIPAQCGVTQCGATRLVAGNLIVEGAGCGSPGIRYVWRVAVTVPRLTWFAAGGSGGRTGQDPHLRIRRAEDLECVLTILKPAHTRLIFDYSGA
jgi:uncharacterized protein YmfQ (DUF2313 family)